MTAEPSRRDAARRRSLPATRCSASWRDVLDDAFDFPGAARGRRERARAAVACSSCSTARPPRSRTSARASSRRRCERLPRDATRRFTILVATSGDTGGAVAAAFIGRPWVDVVVLYPRGLVSARQAAAARLLGRQRAHVARARAPSTTASGWSRRVRRSDARRASAALVRQQHQRRPAAAADGVLRGGEPGALAPRRQRRRTSSCRPATSATLLACLWAREVGLPIGDIVLATNANRTVPDFLRNGRWRAARRASRRSHPRWTSAIRATWSACAGCFRIVDELGASVTAMAIDDEEIRATHPPRLPASTGRCWCPHTATAAAVYRRLGRRSARAALGARRDRASRQVRRDRRAAHRPAACRCRRRSLQLLALPRIETTIDADLDDAATEAAEDR